MAEVSYNKLWKLLIDRGMSRSDLREMAHISTTSLAKLGRDENVSMSVIMKICDALSSPLGEIMDISPNVNSENQPLK